MCIWKCICQIHQLRWIKYRYIYMVWNLIKYKHKYKHAAFVFVFANTWDYYTMVVSSNTNTYLAPVLIDSFLNATLNVNVTVDMLK